MQIIDKFNNDPKEMVFKHQSLYLTIEPLYDFQVKITA